METIPYVYIKREHKDLSNPTGDPESSNISEQNRSSGCVCVLTCVCVCVRACLCLFVREGV